MFLAFSCEEARLKVSLLCAVYRTAWRKRLVMDGAVSLLFAPLLAHSFIRLIYIMSYSLTAGGVGGVGGVSYWQEVRRMELRWALARSLLGRGRGRGALYPSPKRNEEYKQHI